MMETEIVPQDVVATIGAAEAGAATTTTTTTTTDSPPRQNVMEFPSFAQPPKQRQQSTRRLRQLGRSARRRGRKLKEIAALERGLVVRQLQQQVLLQNNIDATTLPMTTLENDFITRHSSSSSFDRAIVVLPTDRNRIWPAVLELRQKKQINDINVKGTTNDGLTNDDEISLLRQLGYIPGNAIQIVCRAKDLTSYMTTTTTRTPQQIDQPEQRWLSFQQHIGLQHDDPNSPLVIQLYPIVYRNPHRGGKSCGSKFKLRKRQKRTNLNPSTQITRMDEDPEEKRTRISNKDEEDDNDDADSMLIEPFPTMYWLTHPSLRGIVSKLELEGYGKQLEQRLKHSDNELYRTMMERAHLSYGQERYDLLSNSDRQLIQSYQWETAFSAKKRGIDGMTNPMAVKCLHAHLAHYLSHSIGCQQNIIG
jgi:hypothetical protein